MIQPPYIRLRPTPPLYSCTALKANGQPCNAHASMNGRCPHHRKQEAQAAKEKAQ